MSWVSSQSDCRNRNILKLGYDLHPKVDLDETSGSVVRTKSFKVTNLDGADSLISSSSDETSETWDVVPGTDEDWVPISDRVVAPDSRPRTG